MAIENVEPVHVWEKEGWNSQRNRGRIQAETSENGYKYRRHEKKSSDGLPTPRGHYSQTEAVDELPNKPNLLL